MAFAAKAIYIECSVNVVDAWLRTLLQYFHKNHCLKKMYANIFVFFLNQWRHNTIVLYLLHICFVNENYYKASGVSRSDAVAKVNWWFLFGSNYGLNHKLSSKSNNYIFLLTNHILKCMLTYTKMNKITNVGRMQLCKSNG